jgi:hypothetical protein
MGPALIGRWEGCRFVTVQGVVALA